MTQLARGRSPRVWIERIRPETTYLANKMFRKTWAATRLRNSSRPHACKLERNSSFELFNFRDVASVVLTYGLTILFFYRSKRATFLRSLDRSVEGWPIDAT
jgi:hypothetical protein